MKKYAIILIFISVFLIWCDTKTWQTMRFNQASSIFSNTIQELQQTSAILWLDGFKSIDLNLDIFGENKDFKLKSEIKTTWFVNYLDNDIQSDTRLNLYFWDKSEQEENNISWELLNIIIQDNLYSILKSSKLNIWTWNYQGELISLIANNLENKWIKTVIPYKSLKNRVQDIKYIMSKLTQSDVFSLTETVSYEWNVAYRVELKPSILQDINSNTDIQVDNFQWLLVVRSASEVEFRIEQLDISWSQEIIIKWFVLPQEWRLRFQLKNNLEDITQFSWEKHKKNISFSVSKLQNTKEMIWLGIKLYPKSTSHKTSIQINWILNFSPMMIYWSDLEKDIKIDINGQYDFADIQDPHIIKPDSYILWDQILWDQFSLETIIVE
jgi:hypothetical protein